MSGDAKLEWQHYRCGVTSTEDRGGMIQSISLLAMLHLVQPWVLLASVAGVCGWLTFIPVLAPQSWLPIQLCHCRSWAHSRERTRTLSLLNVMRFLQSQSSQQPCPQKNSESCCSWLQELRVRRLTNVDDISSFLSLLEKMSCKCKHIHTFEPSMYRYASTDVVSNVLYDKIFNWGGERKAKFKILLLLQKLLNYSQPLVPCE